MMGQQKGRHFKNETEAQVVSKVALQEVTLVVFQRKYFNKCTNTGGSVELSGMIVRW
jgi:hypothetical protein